MFIFKIIINIISYIASGVLMYACSDINNQLINTFNTDNSLEMLGFGISKIFLIPILIILYLLLIACTWTTLAGSIRMLSGKTKALKVSGVILLLINLVGAGFTIYLIIQFFRVII